MYKALLMICLLPLCRSNGAESEKQSQTMRSPPSDAQLAAVLDQVQLSQLLQRQQSNTASLDQIEDWASILSLGEQQRLAFARLANSVAQFACKSAAELMWAGNCLRGPASADQSHP